MKERGMIFNAEMVRAILDGRKTQTRRPVKGVRPDNCLPIHPATATRSGVHTHVMDAPKHGLCPFGVVGDRLWVRETWATLGNEDGHPVDANGNLCSREDAQRIYRASAIQNPGNYGLWTSPDGFDFEGSWTPSIHMPRWASRITLEITDVRVEHLNNISYDDAISEGIKQDWTCIDPGLGLYAHKNDVQDDYETLWKSIYGADSWQANPWVWVIEFKRVEGGAA